MKEFIIEFLKLLSNCILVVCFAFAAFLLIINIYHYEEVTLQYNADINTDIRYEKYKKSLAETDKKMKSVSSQNDVYSKVIYDRYTECFNKLSESSYNKFTETNIISGKVVYNLNNEILNNLSSSCLVTIPIYIEESSKKANFKNDYSDTMKIVNSKRDMILSNARYLTKSEIANSSYSFSTEVFKNTIYNKIITEYDMTIDNYTMIASVLEEIADWYVLEFGGNS